MKILRFLMQVSIVACLVSVFVPAEVLAADVPRLVDNAGLLTDEEYADILSQLDAYSEANGIDLVIVTENSIGSKTAEAYADDWYDYNGFADDGVCLLVSMDDRYLHISTKGFCIIALTDAGIDRILDDIVPYLGIKEYGDGLGLFISDCGRYIKQAKEGRPYDVGHMPKEAFDAGMAGAISLLGVLFSGIVCAVLSAQLRSVKKQAAAGQYNVDGSLVLTHKADNYLYNRVSKVRIDSDSGGGGSRGGGSSTHTSSSGSRHGGGGKHF